MAVYVDVAPRLLEWAVNRAGWDTEAATDRVPQFDRWLAGEKRPTLKQLEHFAHATHAPLGMLFLPEPPVEEIPVPDMRTVRDAALREPSADLLDTIYICQRRQDWYRDYAIREGAVPLQIVGSESITADPEAVGRRLRELLGLDARMVTSWSDAMRDLLARIESLGVLVMVSGIVGSDTHRTLSPDEFRGFTLADEIAPVVFINGADTKAAQIFTLAHELAHVTLGHSALSDVSLGSQSNKAEERWCNAVAAEILIPMSAFSRSFQGATTPDELDRLAHEFKVSTLAILARARDAGALTWDEHLAQFDEELRRVTGLGARRDRESGGNYYYTQPLRLSRVFARAVIASAQEGTTTFRDAYQLLGTKSHSTFEGLAEHLGLS